MTFPFICCSYVAELLHYPYAGNHDTFHEDVGFGFNKAPTMHEALERAKKTAVTDARKRGSTWRAAASIGAVITTGSS